MQVKNIYAFIVAACFPLLSTGQSSFDFSSFPVKIELAASNCKQSLTRKNGIDELRVMESALDERRMTLGIPISEHSKIADLLLRIDDQLKQCSRSVNSAIASREIVLSPGIIRDRPNIAGSASKPNDRSSPSKRKDF